MLPVSKTGYMLLLVISVLLLFYSSSYGVSWETLIAGVVGTDDINKDMSEEIVDSEKNGNETVRSELFAYEDLRIRLGEHVKSFTGDSGIKGYFILS